jgi:hypothetical protein
MIECRNDLGLAFKALPAKSVLRQMGGQNFDGDVAAEATVVRTVDLPHATST